MPIAILMVYIHLALMEGDKTTVGTYGSSPNAFASFDPRPEGRF